MPGEGTGTFYYFELIRENVLDRKLGEFKKFIKGGGFSYYGKNVAEFRLPLDMDAWRKLLALAPPSSKRKIERFEAAWWKRWEAAAFQLFTPRS